MPDWFWTVIVLVSLPVAGALIGFFAWVKGRL